MPLGRVKMVANEPFYTEDHPYYCSAFYSEDYYSWEEFLEELGEADFDYNLLLRFDWFDDEPPARLQLTYIHQRKGYVFQARIYHIKPEDEDSIREFLQPRLDYLLKIMQRK